VSRRLEASLAKRSSSSAVAFISRSSSMTASLAESKLCGVRLLSCAKRVLKSGDRKGLAIMLLSLPSCVPLSSGA